MAAILKGNNKELLETFNAERTAAAAQNIACTGETNTFIAPPTEAATVFRNEILEKVYADKSYKRQINCGRLSVPNIYGKYPNSEDGIWFTQELEPGRAVKDCFLDNIETFLIEKLNYQFTILVLNGTLSIEEKNQLEATNIKVLEINELNYGAFIELYDLKKGAAYLISPDQYILGRWKNFNNQKALNLMDSYLSGSVYDISTLHKSEQELIDQQVAYTLMNM